MKRSDFLTLICFDHCTKQKCAVFQATDLTVDRMLIDSLEAFHKVQRNEIFYQYEGTRENEARRQLKKASYVDVIMKEVVLKDMKEGEQPATKEAILKRVLLTLDQHYPHGQPLNCVQRLLSYSYFRGDLYLAVDLPRYTLNDYLQDPDNKSPQIKALVDKFLRNVVTSTATTLRRLARIGITMPDSRIDPRNISLEFD